MDVRELFHNTFSPCIKRDLSEILEFFDLYYPLSTRKAELLDALADYLAHYPLDWLGRLPERDVLLLRNLVRAGGGVLSLDYPDYPSVVETIKVVQSDCTDEHVRKVWLEPEVLDLIAPYVDQILRENEENMIYPVERLLLGYLNIYGVIELDRLVDLIAETDYPEGLDAEQVGEMLRESPIVKIYQDYYQEKQYFFSPCAMDFDSILESRKVFPEIKDYRRVAWNEALLAGAGAPYSCFGTDTPQYRKLLSMLSGLGYPEGEIEKIIHDIAMDAQYSMDEESAENLFRCVNDKQDLIPGFDRYRECIDIVVEYANSVPKWYLSGYSSDAAGLMKISIRVDESYSGYQGNDEPKRTRVNLYYDSTALSNTSDKVGCAWMIFFKSSTEAPKFRRTVAS